MEVPFDILDYIFSFLKFHPKALRSCSEAHPVLSQVIERYRFRHIIIYAGSTDLFTDSFKPSELRRHFSETPRIVKYVAVLQIEFKNPKHPNRMTPHLEEIASLLPMLPALECIVLRNPRVWWQEDLPQCFRTAVKECLQLPTLQEVHTSFPLSILDNRENINHLSLLGLPEIEPECLETIYPQIKSLALESFNYRTTEVFSAWARRHVAGLQSLKFDLSCYLAFSQVLEICKDTLEDLHLCVRERPGDHQIDLSTLLHLQRLTIHTETYFAYYWNSRKTFVNTYLNEVVNILITAPSSLQQLTIEICVNANLSQLDGLDLSPLRTLTQYSVQIDLYMYGIPQLLITDTVMRSLLAKHDLMKFVKQGMLVVHPNETAPTFSRSYVANDYYQELHRAM